MISGMILEFSGILHHSSIFDLIIVTVSYETFFQV